MSGGRIYINRFVDCGGGERKGHSQWRSENCMSRSVASIMRLLVVGNE